MKILHTADWHLGKSLGNISRHPEQIEVLNEICVIADKEKVDAVLIAGDLFDTFNPPVESVELFYKTLKHLANNGNRVVVAIAGNHDSPERIESPDPLARECGIIFLGYPNTRISPFKLQSGLEVSKSEEGFIEIQLPGQNIPLRLITTPYANERRVKQFLGIENAEEQLRKVLETKWSQIYNKYCDSEGINVLMAHLFLASHSGNTFVEPDDEKPILDIGGAQVIYLDNVPQGVQYVALGHLHRRIEMQNGDSVILYSGSPLSYSLSDLEESKSVTLIEINPGEIAQQRKIALKSGRKVFRKTFASVLDAVQWLELNPYALVELTIESETYLTVEERKSIYSAHDGIVDIIPIVRNESEIKDVAVDSVSLTKSVDELFKEYFKRETNQMPNDQIMSLLKEVMGVEEE